MHRNQQGSKTRQQDQEMSDVQYIALHFFKQGIIVDMQTAYLLQ